MTSTLSLVALAGLPGVGKSTVARAVAAREHAVIVSVDPVEDALHRAGLAASHQTGLAAYLVAEVVARDALRLGHHVVVDAANYVEDARRLWRNLARECAADLIWVEVVCSDEVAHRGRLASRDRGFGSVLEPTWEQVLGRRDATEPWPTVDRDRLLRVDTAAPWEIALDVAREVTKDEGEADDGRMRVARIIPDLVVSDIEATERFYGDFLGLTRERLGLDWVTRYVAPSGALLQVLTHDVAGPMAPAVSITVADVDAAYDDAVRLGLDIVHPLTSEPWGVRRFFVRDPDGNVLNILHHRQ